MFFFPGMNAMPNMPGFFANAGGPPGFATPPSDS